MTKTTTTTATTWTYEGYWNTVLGCASGRDQLRAEFGLDLTDRPGIDEWLGHCEAGAWSEGGHDGALPEEWTDYHRRALDYLTSDEAQ